MPPFTRMNEASSCCCTLNRVWFASSHSHMGVANARATPGGRRLVGHWEMQDYVRAGCNTVWYRLGYIKFVKL